MGLNARIFSAPGTTQIIKGPILLWTISIIKYTAELCLLFPWLYWLAAMLYRDLNTAGFMSFPLALLLGLTGLLTGYFYQTSGMSTIKKTVLSSTVGLLASVLFIYLHSRNVLSVSLISFDINNPVLFLLPAAFLFWWRGLLLGLREIMGDDLLAFFIRGFLAYAVIVFLLMYQAKNPLFPEMIYLQSSLSYYITAFFLLTLMSLGLSNLTSIYGSRGKVSFIFMRWVAVLILLVTIIAVLALTISSAVSYDLWQLFLGILGAVYAVAGFLIYLIFSLLQYPVAWFVTFLQKLLAGRGVEILEVEHDLNPIGSWDYEIVINEYSINIPDLSGVIPWVILVIVTGLLAYLIVRSFFRLHQANGANNLVEVHENLFSWGIFKSDLHSLTKIWHKPDKLLGKAKKGLRRIARHDYHFDNIRSLFKVLLTHTEEAGYGRQESETVHEFLRRLESEKNELPPLQLLADYYVVERYSCRKLDAEEVNQANQIFSTIIKQL